MMLDHDLFGSFPGEIWNSALPAPLPPHMEGKGKLENNEKRQATLG